MTKDVVFAAFRFLDFERVPSSIHASSMSDLKTASSSDWVNDRLACSFLSFRQTSPKGASRSGWTEVVSISSSYLDHGGSVTYGLKITTNAPRSTCQRSAVKLFMWQSSCGQTATDDCQCPIKSCALVDGCMPRAALL